MVTLDMFALDSDEESSTVNSTSEDSLSETSSVSECSTSTNQYNSLDEFLDGCAITMSVRGHAAKKQRVGNHAVDRRPIAFVRFNTRHGKAKPVLIKCLLDSGASESLVLQQYAEKLRKKKTTQGWSTPSGKMTTNQTARYQFTIPE